MCFCIMTFDTSCTFLLGSSCSQPVLYSALQNARQNKNNNCSVRKISNSAHCINSKLPFLPTDNILFYSYLWPLHTTYICTVHTVWKVVPAVSCPVGGADILLTEHQPLLSHFSWPDCHCTISKLEVVVALPWVPEGNCVSDSHAISWSRSPFFLTTVVGCIHSPATSLGQDSALDKTLQQIPPLQR